MQARQLPEHDVANVFGLLSVVVKNLPALVCPKDGEIILMGGAIEMLSNELVKALLNETFPLGGCEIRFLRKAARMTQAQLADLLGVDRVTVARWEQAPESNVGVATSIAIRTVIRSSEQLVALVSPSPPPTTFRAPPRPHPARIELDAPALQVAV